MKVRIELTVDVDRADWDLAYGTDGLDSAAFRQDVKEYMGQTLDCHLQGMENGARVVRFR